MLDQVQRVQIRRMERDVFETDELVKRCLRRLNGRGGGGRSGTGSNSSGSDGSGGGGVGGIRRRSVKSRPGSAKLSSRRVSATGGQFSGVEERETIQIRPDGGIKTRDGEASNTGRRRERSPPPRFEYEVVHPGRIYVDLDDRRTVQPEEVDYVGPARRSGPAQSYSRDRGRDR